MKADGPWDLRSGYLGPNFSGPPPAVIAPKLIDAFNEGRLAGQQAAIEGLAMSPECLDTSDERPAGAEGMIIGTHLLEGAGIAVDLAASHLAGGVVLLIELL